MYVCTSSYESENVCVKAGPITHTIPSFGFVILESNEPGKLDVLKLKEFGLPPGPLYSKIKKGETITLPSGVTVSFIMKTVIIPS